MTEYFADPIVYMDKPGTRCLDLRRAGVDCIPALGMSDNRTVGPEMECHVHAGCVEINLCVRGNLAFETPGRTYPFLPGSIFVSTDRQPHCMRHNPKGQIVYFICFAVPKANRRILGLSARETEWLARSLLHLPRRLFKSTPRVRTAFEALFDAYDTQGLGVKRNVKAKAAALDLLVAVIEAARLLPPKPPARIQALMRAMRDHPERDYPIGRMAKDASISESSFSETFKRAAGLPPHAYLLSCRISRAQKLLTDGKQSIKAVAGLMRFTSAQHFSNVFKRIVGTTPAAFVRSSRAQKAPGVCEGQTRMVE